MLHKTNLSLKGIFSTFFFKSFSVMSLALQELELKK